MMSDWKKYTLGDITQIIGGGTPKTSVPEYWNGNIPWLSVVDFCGDQKKVYKTEKTITKKGLEESSTKMLRKGQLIISARGTVGELAMLGKDMAFNQSCYGLNGISNNVINDFLYYLIKYNLDTIKRNTHGAVFDTITKQTFQQIHVLIPDIPTQTRIASILSSLDDKIELNRRMNQTLEQMAQTLFNHYFVDNIDVDNLPEGWRWQRLDELIYIKHGYAFKGEFFTEEPNTNILLTPGNFKIGGGFNYKKFKYYKGDIPLDYVLNWNDLIVTMTDLSKDGDTLGYSSLVPEIPNKRLLHNQRIGKVVFKGNENLKFYLNWVLRSDSYRSFVLGSATGTTVKHTSPSRICEYRCIIPTDKVIDLFIKQVEAFSKMIGANEIQCDTLSNVRDTLLPKLMSGEIDVDKITDEEQIIETELADYKTA